LLAMCGGLILAALWEPHSVQVHADIIGIAAVLLSVPLIRYGLKSPNATVTGLRTYRRILRSDRR